MAGQAHHFRIYAPTVVADARQTAYGTIRYTNETNRLYGVIERRLKDRDFLAGDYSIADMAAFPWAGYLEQHGFSTAEHPNLARWRETIGARPSIARVTERLSGAFLDVANDTRRSATPADLDRFFGRTEAMPSADYSAVTR
jgi:glutathione S-transferase